MLIPADKTVYLFVRTLESERFTIVLRGVEAMHIWNVRAGSSILDMNVLDSAQLTEEHITSAYQLSDVEKDKQITRALVFAKEAHLKVFEMIPSYGAECVALCEKAELYEGTMLLGEALQPGTQTQ